MSSELVTMPERNALPAMNAAVVTATMEALKTIRQFVAAEMVEGTDFGTIPGAGDKKVMLLPGAQKVNMLYNSYPEYDVETADLSNGHAEFRVTTKLIHRGSGSVIGAGIGSASTMESKYRWRTAGRVCPNCEKDTIKRSKFPDRATPNDPPGWYCFGKIGGCGANFRHDDPAITGQQAGRVENPDIHDVRNTVLKMAKKRSLVDASIGLGCLTELFTQDLEENLPDHHEPEPVRTSQPATVRPDNGHAANHTADELMGLLRTLGTLEKKPTATLIMELFEAMKLKASSLDELNGKQLTAACKAVAGRIERLSQTAGAA